MGLSKQKTHALCPRWTASHPHHLSPLPVIKSSGAHATAKVYWMGLSLWINICTGLMTYVHIVKKQWLSKPTYWETCPKETSSVAFYLLFANYFTPRKPFSDSYHFQCWPKEKITINASWQMFVSLRLIIRHFSALNRSGVVRHYSGLQLTGHFKKKCWESTGGQWQALTTQSLLIESGGKRT